MLNVDIPQGFIVGPPQKPKRTPEGQDTFVPRPKPRADAILFSPEELSEVSTTAQVEKAIALDKELFRQIVRSGNRDFKRLIETIETLETLQYGEQTEVRSWGGGVNETTLRTIKMGNEEIRVIGKAQRGESGFTIKNGVATRLFRHWNAAMGKMETLESAFDEEGRPYSEETTRGVEAMLNTASGLRDNAAEFYGVPRENVPLSDQETSLRHGIQAGDLAFREVFAHRISLISGLDVVPETVLLPDDVRHSDTGKIVSRNVDILSAQRFVSPENAGVTKGEIKKKRDELFTLMARDLSAYDTEISNIRSLLESTTDTTGKDAYRGWSRPNLTNLLVVMGEEDVSKFEEQTIRQMTIQEFEGLLQEGPRNKLAKWAMRIACQHYLVPATDGHLGNTLVDTSSRDGRMAAIDNGLSAGLNRKSSVKNEYGENEEPMDPYRSMVWEAVTKHNNWTLDKDTWTGLKESFSRLKGFLPLLEELSASNLTDKEIEDRINTGAEDKDGHAEFKYLFGMYANLHQNRRIAIKETRSYLKRLGILATHGRPPNLPATRDPMMPGNTLIRYESRLEELRPNEEDIKKAQREAIERFEDATGDDRPM
ncbi:MAG: hypothetical protein RDU25_00910 [Patescibacteria group bacterium]|nr:hypothetical protein [Patescibacteria group bacterium]